MTTGAELADALFELNIPGHMHRGIIDYVERGAPPGGFFEAVLTNDLTQAAMMADSHNQQYAQLLVWHFPRNVWGSTRAVEDWIAHKAEERAAHA